MPEPAKEPRAKKAPKKKSAPRYMLRYAMREGARYIGSNSVSFKLKMSVRKGNTTTESHELVERTERFRDHVLSFSERGTLEMDRQYQRLFTKVRTSERDRPDIDQSPLQGSTVRITERRRRRSIRGEKGKVIPVFVRKTVGMEIDWRDVLPRDPVAVGDAWEADAEAITRRMAPYLDSGTRTRMLIRLEGIDVIDGRRIARLYIDWTIRGMRDKHLFTKAVLAGDARFDMDMQRFVMVDIAGSFVVRGAIIGNGAPEIIQSEGKVSLRSALREEPVAAASGAEDATDAKVTEAKVTEAKEK